MNISNKIREYRKIKGASQKEIALTIGINQAQYSRIESGKVEPTISSLEKIATALGITIADFFSTEKPIDVNSCDKSVIERLKLLEELEEEEKRSIFSIMDMAIAKKRMKDMLTNVLDAA